MYYYYIVTDCQIVVTISHRKYIARMRAKSCKNIMNVFNRDIICKVLADKYRARYDK